MQYKHPKYSQNANFRPFVGDNVLLLGAADIFDSPNKYDGK